MNYTHFTQKRIAIASLCVVIILSAFFLIFTRSPQENTTQTTPTIQGNSQAERVYVKDFHKVKDRIVQDQQMQIENILYNRSSNGGRDPDLYTGVIREGSYTSNSINGVTTTTFFVDVRPTEVTHRITITSTRHNSSLVVSCAPEEQQKNTSAACEDSEYYL